MNIAFVGLGIMGGPMAANLVRAGHAVVGYDVSGERLNALAEAGGKAAGSVAECVAQAETAITMLPDSPQVEEVAFGPDGLLEHGRSGLLHIDMSTVRPETSRRVAQAAAVKGIRALDAPVSGGERGAIDGTLSIMVGGHADDVEAARPILGALGTTIVHVGPAGAARPSRRPTSWSSGGSTGWSRRRSCCWSPPGSTRRRASTCSPAAWPAPASSTSSGTPWSSGSSPRASGSICTTRTWGS
nr:hypothetical protein GCM10020093_107110 [Planobispora longispora]